MFEHGAMPSTDFMAAVLANDLVGWLCMIVLGAMSIYNIALMWLKSRQLRIAARENKAFRRLCQRRHAGIESMFLATREFPDSPDAAMAREVYVECELANWFRDHDETAAPDSSVVERAKSILESTIDSVIANEQHRLERQLSVLAISATIAPFVGLFGTVWGILGCFQALGGSEGASLAALAPGLSTALVVTVCGLIVAIPAAVAYNLLNAMAQGTLTKMESFGSYLMTVAQKSVLERQGGARA